MRLTVLGAGAWGTALAVHAAALHDTCLWARDTAQATDMAKRRGNARYLDGVVWPDALSVTGDFAAALAHASGSLLIIATPMAALDEMLRKVAGHSGGVIWLCKGLQQHTGRLGHEVARGASPAARVGVLSGPSFAIEVAEGKPTALVVASDDAALRVAVVDAFHGDGLRIYTSSDAIGVEVGGAVKNVLAIATGIADGMGLGQNARAALITRGLAEMTRLGIALGAQAETFMGLSGLGDLVLTATGDLSRNRRVGIALAQGLPLARILEDLGHVAEGVHSASMVLQRALASAVDMPITEAVVSVLEGSVTPRRALEQLMGRDSRPEA